MTKDDHERERRAFWDACYQRARDEKTASDVSAGWRADNCLAERDKRFPAPIGGE